MYITILKFPTQSLGKNENKTRKTIPFLHHQNKRNNHNSIITLNEYFYIFDKTNNSINNAYQTIFEYKPATS